MPVDDQPHRVVIALGSNLGDSRTILAEAIARLRALAGPGFAVSSFWQTSPVDCPPGAPSFLNAVAAFAPGSDETPETLLAKLQAIEREMGRERTGILNAARTLDLDLIAFGTEQRSSVELQLPHPRAHLRRFVLAPLAEILPSFRAPGWTATAAELLAGLPDTDEATRSDPVR